MKGMTVNYLGELRCEGTHLKSGNKLITDAPPDNHGRGEAFSPTDLLCTSLASCMITLIGITAETKNFSTGTIYAEIEKIMGSNPRRVSGINIRLVIQDMDYSEKEKEIIRNAALTCPVAKSLHTEITQNVVFEFVKE
ncbi:MAG: OsmC family protein [Crocinitomicaceae bacterium]|nr:OsmC family protein [Crocinitomicaceae bacterium]